MIKTLLFVLLLAFPFITKADAWDNLTREQAEAVVANLKENPYIFEYCDCCDDNTDRIHGARLVKVTHTTIETCEWNQDMFAVRYQAKVIMELTFAEDGMSILNSNREVEEESADFIYMNYTRTLNPVTKLATNFFNVIDYDYYGENRPCKKEFAYPNPKIVKGFSKDKGYKKWFKKNAL